MPTTAIGALLAQVPPPLGFGTVELDDGPCLGFLAESPESGRAGYHRISAAGAPGCGRNPRTDRWTKRLWTP